MAKNDFSILSPGARMEVDPTVDEATLPHAFQLNRLRQVNLDWEHFLVDKEGKTVPNSGDSPKQRLRRSTEYNLRVVDGESRVIVLRRSALHSLFESEYGAQDSKEMDDAALKVGGLRELVTEAILKIPHGPPAAGALQFYLDTDRCGFQAGKPIEDCIVLRRNAARRCYLALDSDGRPLRSEVIADVANSVQTYLSFWSKVHELVLVAPSVEAAKNLGTSGCYVSNEGGRVFDEITLLLPKYEALYFVLKGYRAQIQSNPIDLSDGDATEQSLSNFAKVSSELTAIRGRLAQLRDQVAASNYTLVLDPIEEKLPDHTEAKPSIRTISIGVYSKRPTIYTWVEIVTTSYTESGGKGSSTHQSSSGPVVQRTEIADYSAASRPQEPYWAAITTLCNAAYARTTGVGSFKSFVDSFTVMVATLVGGQLVVEDGRTVVEILKLADHSEAFRSKLILVLPVLDGVEGSRGVRLIRGYWVYARPLPPLVAVRFPRLFIRETLSYALQWQGIEYGSVVKSVCLAPSEKQTVNSSLVAQNSRAYSVSSSSIQEATASRQDEFADSIEQQLRNELNDASQSNSGMEAEIPLEAVSIGMSFSGASQSSLSTFSNLVEKSARRAATSSSSKLVRARSESTTEAASAQQTDASSGIIENPNSGSPLSLLYFQVMNRYIGGLRLERLGAVVMTGRELVAGSGVFEVANVDTSELMRLIKYFTQENLPLFVDEEAWFKHIIRQVVDLLEAEYRIDFGLQDEQPESGALIRLDATLRGLSRAVSAEASNKLRALVCVESVGQNEDRKLEDRKLCHAGLELRRLQKLLADAIYSRTLLNKQKLTVPSGAMVLEAYLGERNATEPFADRMREAAVIKAENEARAVFAAVEGRARCEPARVTAIEINPSSFVMVTLSSGFSEGVWKLYFMGQLLGHWDARSAPGFMFKVEVALSPTQVSAMTSKKAGWALVGDASSLVIGADEETQISSN